MKYRIKIDDLSYNPKVYREVEGEPIVIPGFEEFQFFIRPEDYFVISEVTTGLRIGEYYESREFAIKSAKEILEKAGIEKVRQLVAENKMPEAKK